MSSLLESGRSRSRRGAPRGGLAAALLTLVVSGLLVVATVPGVAAADRIGNYDVVGSILNEYNRLKSIGKSPGNPTANEKSDRQGGRFQDFVNNNHIYWNQRIDPNRGRQIGGAIFNKWATVDYENGALGYPTTSEGDGLNGGKFNFFERGAIYWKSNTLARIVQGQILETWAGNGYERSRYGYPVTDEETIGDGKRQKFENGEYIEWHPNGFDVDWGGDTYQDDDPNNNSDTYVPTCDDQCGADATVKYKGGPVLDESGKTTEGSRSFKQPEPTFKLTNGSQYCDDILEGRVKPQGKKFSCIIRPGTEDAVVNLSKQRLQAKRNGSAAPSAPSSLAPSSSEPSSPAPESSETAPSSDAPSAPASEPAAPTSAPATSAPAEQQPEQDQEDSPSEAPSSTTVAPAANTTQGFNRPTGPPRPRFKRVAQSLPPLSNDKDFCNSYVSDFKSDIWHMERMFACRTKVIRVGFGELDTPPRLVGYFDLRESRNMTMQWNDTVWTEQIGLSTPQIYQLEPGAYEAIRDATMTYTLGCTYAAGTVGCYTPFGGGDSTETFTVQQILDGYKMFTKRRGAVAPGNNSVQALSEWSFKVTAANFTPTSGETGNSSAIRCDAKSGLRSRPGCAFEYVIPVLDYTVYGTLDEFRAHVNNAQASGLPGSVTAGNHNPLYRVVAKETIRQNRAGSCGGVTGPRNNGKSCDEYPFASTDEGGRPNGPNAGQGRTFNPQCNIYDTGIKTGIESATGYSVCLIDATQNSKAGALLAWFYAKNRVGANDPFYVQAAPPSGS